MTVQDRMRSMKVGVLVLLLALAALVPVGPVSAMRTTSVALDDIELTVTRTVTRELRNGRLGIVIDVIGAGVIDCGGHQGCLDAGLQGASRSIEATMGATLDTAKLRAKGRIVIDVIGAGLKGSLRGSLAQTAPDTYDIALDISARATRGARATLHLTGVLERAAGAISTLTGNGIVSMDDIDQI